MVKEPHNKFHEELTQEFLRLLTTNQNIIFGYILTLLPGKCNAEDVYQDTVSTLWEKFPQYEPNTKFEVWACVIAKYKVLQFVRKSQNAKLQFTSEAMELLDTASMSLNERFNDRAEALRRCLKKLPSENLRIIKMRYENGWSVKKIAGVFDQTVQSVYKQLNRVHMALMGCIERMLNA